MSRYFLYLEDKETYSPLETCIIVEVSDDLEVEDQEEAAQKKIAQGEYHKINGIVLKPSGE